MTERYFPEVAFVEVSFKSDSPAAIAFKTDTPFAPIGEVEIVQFDDYSASGDTIEVEIIEDSSSEWSEDTIVDTFASHLELLKTKLQEPSLLLDNRNFSFKTPDEIKPQTESEKKARIERYGDAVQDGIAGTCQRNPDGTFTLIIGYKGEEQVARSDEVLEVLAHEYAHTLGEDLPSPLYEELKAYAFENLFMREYFGAQSYITIEMEDTPFHSKALHMLEQLINKNIPEAAILAHLLGQNFGSFTPDSYKDYLQG